MSNTSLSVCVHINVICVQVGVIILYDHVHPVGAFAKNAPIDVSHVDVLTVGTLGLYVALFGSQ